VILTGDCVELMATLDAESVDAIVTWEPQPSLLEAKGLVKVVQRGGKYLKSPGCVMFGTEYIKKNPDLVRRFVKAHFRGCQFIRQHRDVLLIGPPGLGKSHLVQAIGYHAIKAGFQVLYSSIFDLVRELQADQSPAQMDRTLKRFLKPDLLIVDDMGLKVLPSKSGEVLLEIVMRRYETRSTLMTSNRPIEEWGKLLNDVPAATAILDRLLHHADIIEVSGRSYRLHQAGRKNDKDTQKKK